MINNRIVGLDIGDKRIGVAISDELLITAQPVGYVKVNSYENIKLEIKKIVEEYNPFELVIGLPKKLNGELGIQAKKIIDMTQELKKMINVKIKLWDERLTTYLANKILLEGDSSRRKRKIKIDSIAASIILQNYLDFIKKDEK